MVATVRASSTSASKIATDVVVVGIASSEDHPVLAGGAGALDDAFGGALARALAAAGASGRAEETVRIPTLGAVRAPAILAVGLGPRSEGYSPDLLRRASGAATRALRGTRRVATSLAAANADRAEPADLRAVAEGSLLGAYDFVDFRQDSLAGRGAPVRDVTVLTSGARTSEVGRTLTRAGVVAEAVERVRDLVNTPPGDLPPAALAELAAVTGRRAGLKVEVLDEAVLRRRGYGGITGVGQGSARPPRLVSLRWRPPRAARHVALVGKGITFDSGGLSLKPAKSMEWMKADMAGAASVFATAVAAAQLRLPVAVTAWMPLAENMPGGGAIRPGDVLSLYGGKRVEVLNTDAEGRLVLGDALARAAEDSPDVIIDVATLTGAQIVALGARVTGVMANDDSLRAQVVAASEAAGEQAWPMPLPGELRKGLDSHVADLRNIGDAKLGGGMLVAGLFLREFVPAAQRWAHLDIAGPSYNDGAPHGYTPRGGTGAAVATLIEFLDDIAGQGAG
jgi:leucyl aminopeptidase